MPASGPWFGRPAVEMTTDRAFGHRVVRLACTSAVALGVLWVLARATGAGPAIAYLLAGGWLLMPAILLGSLRRPRLRYALVVPSTLVTVALVLHSASVVPRDIVEGVGWLLITGGVLMGGFLGVWFWFRLWPVPAAFRDPFSRLRWTLIGVHVLLVVVGLLLAGTAMLPGR